MHRVWMVSFALHYIRGGAHFGGALTIKIHTVIHTICDKLRYI